MITLSPEFVQSCPEQAGFHLCGFEMTRTEVFVDATFAFALIGLLSVALATSVPPSWIPYSGFIYLLPGLGIALFDRWRTKGKSAAGL